jgi:ATP-binding cassette subfamily A (ABC1) protein 3
VEERFKEM